jgi:2'-hydroxyisoflavone reductase
MKNSKTRRTFIKNGLVLGLGLPYLGNNLISCVSKSEQNQSAEKSAQNPLRILILGGTSFLGPHQIAYAMARGHSISTFTRGKTIPTIYTDLYQNVEQLIGDRNDNLTALENGEWDVVIDNSGHNAEWTKKSAALLKDKADIYLYTSSTGVYYPYLGSNIDEGTKLLLKEPLNIDDEDLKMEYWYGVMKANSEIETIKAFGQDRSIIVRPTYMIGPADKSDRFIYWPIRLSRGGEIMVPGKNNDPVQYIDVRDVAEWMIRLAEEKVTGTYNAVGPKGPQTMHEFIDNAMEAFEEESTFVKIDDYEFLKENGVHYLIPWIMPEDNNYGTARINNQHGIRNGLTFRDVKDSVKDTFQWWTSDSLSDERRNEFELKPGSILLREKSIIENWRRAQK